MAKHHIAFMFYDRPNYAAGPRINAMRLLPELVQRGHRVTALIGYFGGCPARDFLSQRGVSVRAKRWPPFAEDQVRWFYRTLSDVDPDIFVPNISVTGCYAARFVREAGRPTIATHRSDDPFNWGMAERFCKAGDAWAVAGLGCVGHGLAEGVRAWAPARSQIFELPSGVPVPTRRAAVEGPIRLLYAGRLEQRQKRIHETLDAMLRVLQTDPSASAVLIGDGSERAAIAQRVQASGLERRVELTGFLEPAALQARMLDANVLVLLSDYEGVPGAVMDAMACGLVPVCLDSGGGLRELVVDGETGLLVRDRDEHFAGAIERLRQRPELRTRLADGARAHIERGYSLSVTADRWEAMFDALLADAGERQPLRFPSKPCLPPPHAALAHEDVRATFLGRARHARQQLEDLPRAAARWGRDQLEKRVGAITR